VKGVRVIHDSTDFEGEIQGKDRRCTHRSQGCCHLQDCCRLRGWSHLLGWSLCQKDNFHSVPSKGSGLRAPSPKDRTTSSIGHTTGESHAKLGNREEDDSPPPGLEPPPGLDPAPNEGWLVSRTHHREFSCSAISQTSRNRGRGSIPQSQVLCSSRSPVFCLTPLSLVVCTIQSVWLDMQQHKVMAGFTITMKSTDARSQLSSLKGATQ